MIYDLPNITPQHDFGKSYRGCLIKPLNGKFYVLNELECNSEEDAKLKIDKALNQLNKIIKK